MSERELFIIAVCATAFLPQRANPWFRLGRLSRRWFPVRTSQTMVGGNGSVQQVSVGDGVNQQVVMVNGRTWVNGKEI